MTLRWIETKEQLRWLGALGLDPARNFHAKTVLAMWNRAENFVFPSYPTPDDLTATEWNWRDAQMLGNFTIWWNNPSNPPLHDWGQFPLENPSFVTGIQQSDLTPGHLQALDTWATKTGAGLPSCIEQCVGTNTSLEQITSCVATCGATGLPSQPGIPAPHAPGPSHGGNPPLPPAQTSPNPPLPAPPEPIPSTTPTSGTSSRTGLLVMGAIALAAVAIFAAVVSGSGAPAAR